MADEVLTEVSETIASEVEILITAAPPANFMEDDYNAGYIAALTELRDSGTLAAHVALVVEQHTNGRIAELEAELEKQKRGGRTLGKAIDRTLKWVIEASNSEDLIGDDGDGDWEIVWDRLFQLRPNLEAAIDRAEKAEATIARVRGEVSAYSEIIPAVALADLRAALEGES